jgi:hypothetical protein
MGDVPKMYLGSQITNAESVNPVNRYRKNCEKCQ